METSGTDMLSDSDNRATISPLHLAVSSTACTANLMAGLLKTPHVCANKLVPRTFDPCNDDHGIKTLRTSLFREFMNVLLCFILFCFECSLGFPRA